MARWDKPGSCEHIWCSTTGTTSFLHKPMGAHFSYALAGFQCTLTVCAVDKHLTSLSLWPEIGNCSTGRLKEDNELYSQPGPYNGAVVQHQLPQSGEGHLRLTGIGTGQQSQCSLQQWTCNRANHAVTVVRGVANLLVSQQGRSPATKTEALNARICC